MTLSTTGATIEQVLGPGDARYFGRGFQRVTQVLTDVAIGSDRITGTVSATARVDYPTDWSTKTTPPPGPHLSTVDALIIAGQLAEAYLTHGHRLDSAARARMWLRGFEMKSGAAAQTALAAIPVQGRRSSMRLGPWGTNTVISVFEFRIGALRLSCQVQHEVGTPVVTPATWPDLDQLLGPAADRQYGRGFAQRRHDIRDLVIDAPRQHARATVHIAETQPGSPEGMAASFEPTLSLIDATVCTAQLAQVLAYHREDVHRDQTDTLWMRRFGMRRDTPTLPITDPVTMAGRVLRRRRVDRMGKSWRMYDMDGDIGGIHIVASLAFNVPGAADGEQGDGDRR
jgi:hypothetical protein